MKLTSRQIQRERKIELSMTSMIDMIFLLLIFFMTTSGFVLTERHLESATKVQSGGASTAADLQPAVVEVVPAGQGYVYRLGQMEFRTTGELTGLLSQFDNKADGAFVRVSDEAPFRMAAAAIQACKTAGFAVVSYIPLRSNP